MTRNSFRRMENKLTPIDLLIANNLSDSATPAESAELKAWIGESPRNKKIFEDHQRIWENSHPYLAVSDIISDCGQIKDLFLDLFAVRDDIGNSYVGMTIFPYPLVIFKYLFISGRLTDPCLQFCRFCRSS